MLIHSVPLATTASALRSGQLDLLTSINETSDRIDAAEPLIHALLPESDRRSRLRAEAEALQVRYPDPASRPPLYGILLGVKDIFRADGFPTQAGSQLPAELFDGSEAACFSTLREAGALILGKTISTEFAFAEPGPTRNPHHLEHTPGGSSSGSAAAVAAGYCPLALGTQTIGSVIRPAAFCGIVGFKPTYGRISREGLILCAESLDTVGFFTQDVAGTALVAGLLCSNWQPIEPNVSSTLPVLGVPDGPYLARASTEGLAAFEQQLTLLEEAGYTVQHVPTMEDIEAIHQRHMRLVFAEMAQVHAEWFAQYEALYRPRTAAAIREGRSVSAQELAACRASRTTLRTQLEFLMAEAGIDLWISPAARGPAPQGITTTGDPIMNLPWTHAGMPVITLPAGFGADSLPVGLQVTGATMTDERLIFWAGRLAQVVVKVPASA